MTMIRGFNLFKCDNCGKVNIGIDVELGASAFSEPMKCGYCSSTHTYPLFSSKSLYKKIWKIWHKKS